MALLTLGTTANNSLQAFLWNGAGSVTNADIGNANNLIKDDIVVAHPIYFDAFMSGMLFIPNRGVLKVLPGDFVGIDSQGWPILVSKNSIANAAWTHS